MLTSPTFTPFTSVYQIHSEVSFTRLTWSDLIDYSRAFVSQYISIFELECLHIRPISPCQRTSPLYRCKSEPHTVVQVTRTSASSGSVISGISCSSTLTSCLPCHWRGSEPSLRHAQQMCTHDEGFHTGTFLPFRLSDCIIRALVFVRDPKCFLQFLITVYLALEAGRLTFITT
jgi:hypothetical protein